MEVPRCSDVPLVLCLFAGTVLLSLVGALNAHAAINSQIPFYGTLKDSSGSELSGTYDMVFRFYDAPSGGTLLDTSTHTAANGNAVTVSEGEFNVLLGSGSGNTLDGIDFDADTIYVGLTVESDSEMTPRERLGAAPYAFNSDTLDGYDSTKLLRFNATGSISTSSVETLLTITQSGTGDILNIYDSATEVFTVLDGGNVGIGTSSPARTLTLDGDFELTGALYDASASAGLAGYVLQSTGSGTEWVATSTLGISGGSSLFTDGGVTTYLTATGDQLAIGTTTGRATLAVDGDLFVGTTSVPALFVSSTTHTVGIATTSPAYTLDVRGSDFRFGSSNTNYFMMRDTSITSSAELNDPLASSGIIESWGLLNRQLKTYTSAGENDFASINNILEVDVETGDAGSETVVLNNNELTFEDDSGPLGGIHLGRFATDISNNTVSQLKGTSININMTDNATATDVYGIDNGFFVFDSVVDDYFGMDVGANFNNTNGNNMYAILGRNSLTGASNVFTMHGISSNNQAWNTSHATTAYGFRTSARVDSSASMGTVYSYFAETKFTTGSIDTAYGLYIDDLIATDEYGVFQAAHEARNIFAGDMTIGTTSTSTTAKLTVASSTSNTLAELRQYGTGDILNLFDGASEVLTILNGGNVGVGTTSPGSRLSVEAAEDTALLALGDSTNGRQTNVYTGTTSPDGRISAPIGSLFVDTDAGDLYQNTTGDASGWEPFTQGTTTHMAKMTRDTAQSIPNGSPTKIAFDTVVYDTGNIADATTNDRFDIERDGKYLVTTSWTVPNMASGDSVFLYIRKNGSQITRTTNQGISLVSAVSTEVLDLQAGDHIEMYVAHNIGTSQNTQTGDDMKPQMTVTELSAVGGGGGGSSLFTDDGTDTYLTSLTDNLLIGTSTNSGSAKFVIDQTGTNDILNIFDNGAEVLTILDGGSLGIGTSSPGSELTVDGTIEASNLYGGATNLTTDANGNIIRDPSDARLKTNITDIENALDTVLALRGVRYEWKDTERFGNAAEIGFIAQEVEPILPEVVRDGGEYYSMNTRNILAVVVEAMQEMWAAVTGNTGRIDELEERVRMLESQLQSGNDVTTDGPTEDESGEQVPDSELSPADEKTAEDEYTDVATSTPGSTATTSPDNDGDEATTPAGGTGDEDQTATSTKEKSEEVETETEEQGANEDNAAQQDDADEDASEVEGSGNPTEQERAAKTDVSNTDETHATST